MTITEQPPIESLAQPTSPETEALNAYALSILEHVLFGDERPDISGDALYDAVWALRMFDQALAPLRDRLDERNNGVFTADEYTAPLFRLLDLEDAIEAQIDARNQHPAGQRMEGLLQILHEVYKPEQPPLRLPPGVVQADIDWHGTGTPGFDDADRDQLSVSQLLQ